MKASKAGGKSQSARKRVPKADLGPDFGLITIRDVSPDTVFRFQLGPALLDQLRAKLESLNAVPLVSEMSAPYPGFYQLIVDGIPRYIGKTNRSIQERLSEHWSKLSKMGLPLDTVTCRYAFVDDLSLVDITEKSLIRYFGTRGEAEWNGSGLGSKVTGYGRGGQKASKFSEMYPPDIDRSVKAGSNEPLTLRQLLRQIDYAAPLHVKIPKKFAGKFADDFNILFDVPIETRRFTDWIGWIEDRIAPGWRVDRQPMSWYVVPTERET